MGLDIKDYYQAGRDNYSNELSTLTQRTNFFLVSQALLVTVISFSFKEIFPYASPLMITGFALIGILFSIFTCESGRESSESLMRWRLYLKNLEATDKNSPWNWYYIHYKKYHKCEILRLIDNIPMPIMWLIYPAIFNLIWFGFSAYVPIRLIFDKTYLDFNIDFKGFVNVFSWIVFVIALVSLLYFTARAIQWKMTRYKNN